MKSMKRNYDLGFLTITSSLFKKRSVALVCACARARRNTFKAVVLGMLTFSGTCVANSSDGSFYDQAQSQSAVAFLHASPHPVYSARLKLLSVPFEYTGEPVRMAVSASGIHSTAAVPLPSIVAQNRQHELRAAGQFVSEYWQLLLLALTVFIVGAASPGPCSLMILNVAISHGRRQAVHLSSGVIAGEIIWALAVAMGFIAVIKSSPTLFLILNVAVGLYLLYLAFKCLRSCLSDWSVTTQLDASSQSPSRQFLKGLLVTLTNPQVAVVWVATFSVSMEVASHTYFFPLIIGFCSIFAVLIYSGYAVLFSTDKVTRVYATMHRPIDLAIAVFFGFAAIKILSLANV